MASLMPLLAAIAIIDACQAVLGGAFRFLVIGSALGHIPGVLFSHDGQRAMDRSDGRFGRPGYLSRGDRVFLRLEETGLYSILGRYLVKIFCPESFLMLHICVKNDQAEKAKDRVAGDRLPTEKIVT